MELLINGCPKTQETLQPVKPLMQTMDSGLSNMSDSNDGTPMTSGEKKKAVRRASKMLEVSRVCLASCHIQVPHDIDIKTFRNSIEIRPSSSSGTIPEYQDFSSQKQYSPARWIWSHPKRLHRVQCGNIPEVAIQLAISHGQRSRFPQRDLDQLDRRT